MRNSPPEMVLSSHMFHYAHSVLRVLVGFWGVLDATYRHRPKGLRQAIRLVCSKFTKLSREKCHIYSP